MRARSKEKNHTNKAERKSGTRLHKALRTTVKISGFIPGIMRSPCRLSTGWGLGYRWRKETPQEATAGVKDRRDYGLEQGVGTGPVTALQSVLQVNWLQVNTLLTCCPKSLDR